MSHPVGFFTRLRTLAKALGLARKAAVRERWTRPQLEAYQRQRLESLVAHASVRSAFYRERLGGPLIGEKVDLSTIAPLTKGDWMAGFDRVVTDPRLTSARVEAHVEVVREDELYLGEYRIMASSGSTGRRGVYVWSRRDWLEALAIFMRPSMVAAISPRLPRVRIASIGAPDAKHMSYRFGASVDAGVYRTLRLAATAPPGELAAALERFQPHVLIGYPSLLATLAAEQLAGRLRIAPRNVCTSSELRTEEMTRLIREAWNVEPANAYALTETGLAGWTCERDRLHVSEDTCILEPVDEDGSPVPPGQPGARTLVTSLLNFTQPVIRLEVSDQLAFDPEPCACGRTLRTISALHGRADDVLDLPAAAGGRMRIHPIHVRSPLAALREVVSYQILQRPRELEILVVLKQPDEALPGRIVERIRAVLRERGVADVAVRVRVVDRIAREPGVGKLKLVKVLPDAAAA